MQTASSRIWTRVVESTPENEKRYAASGSVELDVKFPVMNGLRNGGKVFYVNANWYKYFWL